MNIETGAAHLLALQKRLKAQRIRCVLVVDPTDVPKLYAYASMGRTTLGHGPHEVVSIGQGFDLWVSEDGRNPQCIGGDISEERAMHILTADYVRLMQKAG